jgi:hypothetical protein
MIGQSRFRCVNERCRSDLEIVAGLLVGHCGSLSLDIVPMYEESKGVRRDQ